MSFAEKFAGRMALVGRNGDMAAAALAPAAPHPHPHQPLSPAGSGASRGRPRSELSAAAVAHEDHVHEDDAPADAPVPQSPQAVQPSAPPPMVKQPSFRRAAPPTAAGARISLDALRHASQPHAPAYTSAEPPAGGSMSARYRDFSPMDMSRSSAGVAGGGFGVGVAAAAPTLPSSQPSPLPLPSPIPLHEASALAAAAQRSFASGPAGVMTSGGASTTNYSAIINNNNSSSSNGSGVVAAGVAGGVGMDVRTGGAAVARARAGQQQRAGAHRGAVVALSAAHPHAHADITSGARNEARVRTEEEKLFFSRKARPVDWQPHNFADYRAVREVLGMGATDPRTGEARYYELGRLGPDPASEELLAKRAAREKARAYAAAARVEQATRAQARLERAAVTGSVSSASVPSGSRVGGGVRYGVPPSSSDGRSASFRDAELRGGTAETHSTSVSAMAYAPLAGLPYGPAAVFLVPPQSATSPGSRDALMMHMAEAGGGGVVSPTSFMTIQSSASMFPAPASSLSGAPPSAGTPAGPARATTTETGGGTARRRAGAAAAVPHPLGRGAAAAATAAAAAARQRALDFAKQVPRPRQRGASELSTASPPRSAAPLAPVPEHGDIAITAMFSPAAGSGGGIGFVFARAPSTAGGSGANTTASSPRSTSSGAPPSASVSASLVAGLDALQQQHDRLREEAARIRRELAL